MATKAKRAGAPSGRAHYKTITASVIDELREQIISGLIQGGSPLRQEVLAQEFGCSLIPIREALLSLKGEGLVEFIPHKGAIAKEINIKEVDELFTLRALLECDILARAMPNLAEDDVHRAESILAQFEELLKPGTELQTWGQLNWEFHKALYEPANRAYTLSMVERLHTNCDRYIRLQLQLDEKRSQAHSEHLGIMERVRKKDKAGAVKVLREHILVTGERLIESLSTMAPVKKA